MFILNDFFHWFSKHWVKISIIAALGVWSAILAWPQDTVQIIFCNAGQGDETLIQHGFYQILIDSSRPGRALDCLSRHAPFFDRTIEAMVITHPQLDHFGGAEQVLERYTVMRYVYNGFGSESPEWTRLSEKLREKNVPISIVSAGDEIRAGDVQLKVLWPEEKTMVEDGKDGRDGKDGLDGYHPNTLNPLNHSFILGVQSSREPNSDAIVLAMTYGKFGALFTSDIGEKEEQAIIHGKDGKDGLDGNLSVLKVAHHGSKTSSSTKFLEAIRPVLAVIEVGKNNYGHPTREAIDRLAAVGARVLRTDQDGDVVVETDGKQWKISTNKQK